MVVMNVCKFLNCLIKLIFCLIFMQVDALILQCVEIPFHRRIVIWISGFAHALRHLYGFAEFCERPGCVLRALIRMQDQFSFDCRLGIQRLLQCPYRKITRDLPVCNTGYNTPVVEVDDAAVVSHLMVLQKQVSEICAPFLIDRICGEFLLQLVFKHFMRFPVLISGLLRTHNRMKSQLRIHIFMYRCWTVKIAFTLQIGFHTPVPVNPIM